MILCDASPLVALVNKADSQHQECVNALRSIQGQLVTTWALRLFLNVASPHWQLMQEVIHDIMMRYNALD